MIGVVKISGTTRPVSYARRERDAGLPTYTLYARRWHVAVHKGTRVAGCTLPMVLTAIPASVGLRIGVLTHVRCSGCRCDVPYRGRRVIAKSGLAHLAKGATNGRAVLQMACAAMDALRARSIHSPFESKPPFSVEIPLGARGSSRVALRRASSDGVEGSGLYVWWRALPFIEHRAWLRSCCHEAGQLRQTKGRPDVSSPCFVRRARCMRRASMRSPPSAPPSFSPTASAKAAPSSFMGISTKT